MLQGGVPKSFGNLSYLSKLYIPYNNLSGQVPLLFQNLSGNIQTTLEYLELASNQLSGALPDITRFSSLRNLALDGNQLNGFLPQILSRPSRLEYLFLSRNEIGGPIPDLRAFPRLKGLFISRNKLQSLHESIWKLSKLQVLYAYSNLFNFSVTEAHFSNLASLTSLDLSYNKHLALKLCSHWVPPVQLTELYISYCNVGPHFPQWIHTQKTLFAVDLSYNGIIDTIPNWFWNMFSINYLNLSHNQISGRIPDFSLGVSSAVVDLSFNNFSGPIPSFLFYSQTLQVSKNKFSGSISRLCKLCNELIIEILDLSKNQLTGELPDCWMNKNNLMVLNLANNNFSGKIPYSIGTLQVLTTLQLHSNNFIGELPSSLKNCTNLRFIDLGENKLTGNFPAWIGTYLTSLRILSLRLNKFHGELPLTICHLTRIKILDISRNNISGRIPFCFNNFTSLVQKNSSIDNGYITSVISPTLTMYFDDVLVFWKRQELEHRKPRLLKGIDLSGNGLTGTFPEEFSNLRGMVFLNLSRNQLTGKIISNIDQMESLEWLDLSRNQFSGKIPTGLARLHYFSVLALSNNNLIGEIPLGTQLQSFDPSVYHGNRLCGRPL